MNWGDIRDIALKVRRACEMFSVSQESESFDYHGDDELGGMCATASFALRKYLKKKGIEVEVISGDYKLRDQWFDRECHCWVEYRGYIIDITATQFGINEAVHITSNREKYYRLRKVPKMSRLKWCKGQQPNREVVDKILQLAESVSE